jgi:hypothetical protein
MGRVEIAIGATFPDLEDVFGGRRLNGAERLRCGAALAADRSFRKTPGLPGGSKSRDWTRGKRFAKGGRMVADEYSAPLVSSAIFRFS